MTTPNASLVTCSSFEPSSGPLIVARCAQIRALRDSDGSLPEPLWYSVPWCFGFCRKMAIVSRTSCHVAIRVTPSVKHKSG